VRKKYLIFSPVITDSFPLHKKIKKDLLKLISKSKGDSYQNKTSTMTDDLSKTDWPLSNDFSRPWVKKYGPMIKDFLTKQVLELGYRKIDISRLWYQQYKQNQTHGWHHHARNYTGAYYVEFPKGSEPTQLLFAENLDKTFSVRAKEGDMILFPSYLIHRSPPIKNNKRKTIISWNLDLLDIHPYLFYDRKIRYLEEVPDEPKSN